MSGKIFHLLCEYPPQHSLPGMSISNPKKIKTNQQYKYDSLTKSDL